MKLTDLFTGEKSVVDNGKVQTNTVKSDVLNRQIRAMVPGQTIQGEVVAKNGNEVQIRVSDDLVLQAKLEQNMNLEIGKSVTFEVKNNGKILTLSPLYTNVATDANVLKALDMASLPVNDTTVSLTQQLMEAGLSINRNSLQQAFREINLFPKAEVSDIVNLHKMQMPVNEANVSQMSSYRNLTHQLVTGLNNVLEEIPNTFSSMMESGNTEGAAKLYQQLVLLAQEAPMAEGNLFSLINHGEGALQTDGMESFVAVETATKTVITENIGNDAQGNAVQGNVVQGNVVQATVVQGDSAQTQVVLDNLIMKESPLQGQPGSKVVNLAAGNGDGAVLLFTESSGIVESMVNTGESTVQGAVETQENGAVINQAVVQTQSNDSTMQTHTSVLSQLPKDLDEHTLLAYVKQIWQESSGDKNLLKPLVELLKNQWTITPDQVADRENVEGLYRKISKQMNDLAQTLENVGQSAGNAYKAVTNLSQNIDFMNQINQVYTYVQLPLRLQQGEAHGDLYVYTNKKHLAAKDGQISALLHLDMEHLGPVDVYVSMMQENVSTKFYLQDDEMLSFVMEHMDVLTDRLMKRGYKCSFEMKVRTSEEGTENVMKKLLEKETSIPLAEYAFDVRT